jgi:hypothetical protein
VAAKPLTQSEPIIEVTVWEFKQGSLNAIRLSGMNDRYELIPTVQGESTRNKVEIRNVGDASLTIYDITVEGVSPTPGHTVIRSGSTGQIPFTLAPGGRRFFYLNLGPTNVPDFYQARLSISHNDPAFTTPNPYKLTSEGKVINDTEAPRLWVDQPGHAEDGPLSSTI